VLDTKSIVGIVTIVTFLLGKESALIMLAVSVIGLLSSYSHLFSKNTILLYDVTTNLVFLVTRWFTTVKHPSPFRLLMGLGKPIVFQPVKLTTSWRAWNQR